jgi:hypothetical protein
VLNAGGAGLARGGLNLDFIGTAQKQKTSLFSTSSN